MQNIQEDQMRKSAPGKGPLKNGKHLRHLQLGIGPRHPLIPFLSNAAILTGRRRALGPA